MVVVRLLGKQYFEDIDEEIGYDYRYWDLLLDVDGQQYGVRIYTDDPGKGHVAVSPRPVDPAQHLTLRALARYLEEHERGAKLFVIGDRGGYEELEAAIERKPKRSSARGGG